MGLETLEGRLSEVRYHEVSPWEPSGMPFLIGILANGSTVKGLMHNPVKGDLYKFYGHWKSQKNYQEDAFFFSTYSVQLDNSHDSVIHYLRKHVKGIGSKWAQKIAEELDTDVLCKLTDDPHIVASIDDLPASVIDIVIKHFESELPFDPKIYGALFDMFDGFSIEYSLVKKLIQDFEASAPDVVKESPYILLDYPRIGWETVDRFATNRVGHPREGVDRHVAALIEAAKSVTEDGHTIISRSKLEMEGYKLLGMAVSDDGWNFAITSGELVRVCSEPDFYSLAKVARAERTIASRLEALLKASEPLNARISTEGLYPEQIEALRFIGQHPVCLLIGPPGTGKSTTMAMILKGLHASKVPGLHVAAPTGKAAKRAQEILASFGLTDIPCTTIHKLLSPTFSKDEFGVPQSSARMGRGRDKFGFAFGEGNKLATMFLVIDEASMLDVLLGSSLVQAIPDGCHVLFVGDEDQLPSVGPGSVLRDMIAAKLPTVRLSEIRRSDGGGRVVRACHALADGRLPQPASKINLPLDNWLHVEMSDMDAIAARIVELHSPKSFDPLWDMQVITAQNDRHPIACRELNRRLSLKLNPLRGAEDKTPFERPFRIGDKVIRTKNGSVDGMIPVSDGQHIDFSWNNDYYRCVPEYVVNGDMGKILDVIPGKKGGAIVMFRNPERLCRVSLGDHHLMQAYAITCHRSQGSGFPYVIVPVHTVFYWDHRSNDGLFSKELFYTSISRAEKLLVTVGPFDAIRQVVGRKTLHVRQTRLKDLLEAMEMSNA